MPGPEGKFESKYRFWQCQGLHTASSSSLVPNGSPVYKVVAGSWLVLLPGGCLVVGVEHQRTLADVELPFIGCNDHIATLVLKNFDVALIQLGLEGRDNWKWLANKKNVGTGYISIPFHFSKLLGNSCLGVHRLAWFAAKRMHDSLYPSKHAPQVIQCSLGRSRMMGVTATAQQVSCITFQPSRCS